MFMPLPPLVLHLNLNSYYTQNCDQGMDRISELPDDILVSIMSPMPMEEAVKTSILSRRWRYLWANQTHLYFNHLVILPEIFPVIALYCPTTDQKTKYINWVNQVVDLHCSGPCLDTFKVECQFDNNAADHIDKWVRFATLKKVKHLHLSSYNDDNIPYTIGYDILKPSPSLPLGDGDISFLLSLHLHGIDISGDVLEYLLSRCRLLERLHVDSSITLKRLKVSGADKLKQLTIKYCINLVELEIDAANLVSIYYHCSHLHSNLVFKSIPILVEVAVGGCNLKSILPRVSHLAGQLSKFSLVLMACDIPGGFVPSLSNLKQLTLKLVHNVALDLGVITNLVESCQMLLEFKLELTWGTDEIEMEAYELKELDLGDDDVEGDDIEGEVGGDDIEGEVERDDIEGDLEDYVGPLQLKSFPNLKVLHVAGFIGTHGDVDLILYFVDFACNLETIICDSRRFLATNPHDNEFVEASRSRAHKFAKIIPPKICVEII